MLHRFLSDPVLFYTSAGIVSVIVWSQVKRLERFRRRKVLPWLDKHGIMTNDK